jgi:hypothetical protein
MQQQEETWQERHARELKETMEAVQYAWAQLKELGVKEIEIEFEGGGDQGQIEEITTEPKVNTSCPFLGNEVAKDLFTEDGGHQLYADLRDVLETWAYKLLDETGEDWVNNDGGYGSITVTGFQKEKLEVVTDMNVRIMSDENSTHEMEIPMDFDQLMIQAKQQARRVA